MSAYITLVILCAYAVCVNTVLYMLLNTVHVVMEVEDCAYVYNSTCFRQWQHVVREGAIVKTFLYTASLVFVQVASFSLQ